MKDIKNEILEYFNKPDLLPLQDSRAEIAFKNVYNSVCDYVPKNKSLLDFGCGTGLLSFKLASNGYKVLGVDISERFINRAKEKYIQNKDIKNLKYEVIGNVPLLYQSESFDCIVTCAVLEHCYDIDKILEDFHRLVKIDGIIVISTPNLISPFTRIRYIFQRISGKRKRFHLYGTPFFLIKTFYYQIIKRIQKQFSFIYVNPNYEKYLGNDEDVTYLSNHLDFMKFLPKIGFEILELSRGTSKFGKFISNYLPTWAGDINIVARKIK